MISAPIICTSIARLDGLQQGVLLPLRSPVRTGDACIDISQEELDADDDPLFEFIELQMVQIVPAVQAVQLFVTTDDGTGEGIILYMRNVPDRQNRRSGTFNSEFPGRGPESVQGRIFR